ncbi:MAG: carbon-nitrogen hydrolase family protein [Puniceicoccaceae bacterium]|nr:MAG: carbon-nitrogen hydrolase family protein [Puniceicoccaceae bacterium]
MGFHLGLIQMRVDGGDKAANLARAESHISAAAAAGCQVVLLPEAMDLGWTHPAALDQAEPIPGGEPFRRLAAAATAHQVWVCAGLTERDRDRVYNAAVLISPQGKLRGLHRKIHELDIGRPYYAAGDRIGVVTTDLGVFGLMICADANAPERFIGRSLGRLGAQIILSPCAWAVTADHDQALDPYGGLWREAYQPLAREFGLWVAGASNVGPMTGGPWQGRNCIGCSLVVDPAGKVVREGPYGKSAEAILRIPVDLEPAAASPARAAL